MLVLVEVTQDHIDSAVPRSASRCMVAKAVQDLLDLTVFALPGCSVTQTAVYFYPKLSPRSPQPLAVHFPLSEYAMRRIIAFDRYEKVEPFSFYLDVPAQYLKIDVPKFTEYDAPIRVSR